LCRAGNGHLRALFFCRYSVNIRPFDPRRAPHGVFMSQSEQVVNDIVARYFRVLGAAAADLWSELPQELQHALFERAVVLGHQGERDESLREQLAKFLHDHHARTLTR
jgi:hypothetical protein